MQDLINDLDGGKKGVYERRLIRSDVDSMVIEESLNWVDASDIAVEIELDLISDATASSVMCKGSQLATSGFFRLAKFSDIAFQIYVARPDDQANPDRQFFEFAVPLTAKNLKIVNLEVFVDNVLTATITEMLGINLSTSLNKMTVGDRSDGFSLPLTANIKWFKLESETFNLNRANGATIVGDAGTLGTIYTDNPGGLDHINNEIINRIGSIF